MPRSRRSHWRRNSNQSASGKPGAVHRFVGRAGRTPLGAEYPVTGRNRLRRRHERGHYDHATVHAILDAAMVCHIAYFIDGQPFCTPTSFWREAGRLYWHGSPASRMMARSEVSFMA